MSAVDSASALFRAEALQGGNRLHGALVLARPPSFTLLTALAVVLVGALLAFFLLASASSTARVAGVLTPTTGVLRIVANVDGSVARSLVTEGQAVRAGDPLFLLRDERVDASVVDLIRRRRDSLVAESRHRAAQAAQRLVGLRERRDALRDEQARGAEALTLARRRVELDRAALQRQERLQAHGMGTIAAMQDRESALIGSRQQLAQQELAALAAARAARDAEHALRDADAQRRRDDGLVDGSLAALDQELAEHRARRESLIRAPAAGRVSALQATAGQRVTMGAALAALWPAGAPLEAEFMAPARAAGSLEAGMPVRLQLDAFAHHIHGAIEGRIRSVDLIASGESPAFRVRVALPSPSFIARGVAHPLRPGMTLEAVVPLERRRLYEWAIEPLRRLSGIGLTATPLHDSTP